MGVLWKEKRTMDKKDVFDKFINLKEENSDLFFASIDSFICGDISKEELHLFLNIFLKIEANKTVLRQVIIETANKMSLSELFEEFKNKKAQEVINSLNLDEEVLKLILFRSISLLKSFNSKNENEIYEFDQLDF